MRERGAQSCSRRCGGLARDERRGAPRLRDALRPAGREAISGLARRRRARRLRSGWATTRKRGRCSSTGRWRSLWSTICSDERLQVRVPGPGRDRHQRQPVRSGHGFHPLSSCIGPAGRDARHVGLCARRHGHGVVLFLRCGARGRSDGGCGRARGADRARRRRGAGGRRTHCGADRGLECRPARDTAAAGSAADAEWRERRWSGCPWRAAP